MRTRGASRRKKEKIEKVEEEMKIKVEVINDEFKETQSEEDIDRPMVTRGQLRRERRRKVIVEKLSKDLALHEEEERIMEDDTVRLIEPDQVSIFERQARRKKFINKLFSYQSRKDIFRFDDWKDLQQSDENLSILYKYLKSPRTVTTDKLLNKQWKKLIS